MQGHSVDTYPLLKHFVDLYHTLLRYEADLDYLDFIDKDNCLHNSYRLFHYFLKILIVELTN